jgi:hypothetical protein
MKKVFFINLFIVVIHSCFSRQAFIMESGGLFSVQIGTNQYIPSSQDDGIIGSWSLMLQAFDENSNGKLDDAERKKGNSGRHFYHFNSDGTCLIHTLKLKGTYELKNEGGKKRLYTYVIDEGKPTPENKWYVISVSKTELILLSQDKYAFWIYKRV